MEFTVEENELITMMVAKYKGHVLATFQSQGATGTEKEKEAEDILADLFMDFEQFEHGTKEFQAMNPAVHWAIVDVLEQFDITDELSPLSTVYQKTMQIIMDKLEMNTRLN